MDKPATFLVILIYSLGLLHGSKSITNRGYVFTAPGKLLAGETASGCLSLHNLKPPAYVTLELLSSWDKSVTASTNILVNTSVEVCMPLEIPWTPYIAGYLRLKIKFDKYPSYVVEEEKEVLIKHDSVLTFVETDKVIYKPGQDVNIRILMLRYNLKPWKEPIPRVWIENPSEVKVAEWRNVSTENGLVQLKFPLSPEPSSGTWNIIVEKIVIAAYPELTHTTKFEVEKYVLPRFQISINSPEYILMDVQNMTWNICVRYTYGKPVKGTLLLKLTPQTPSWKRKPHLPAIRYETEFDKPDGCTDFVLSGTVLGLAHWQADPSNVVLVAEFTEAGTGVVETTISRTVVMHEALKLEFENYTPKYFKLGLPYHGKLRVLQHDNTPMPNIEIQVCLKVRGEIKLKEVECRDFMSSTDGFVDFIVPPQDDKNIDLLTFVATAVNYPTKYYTEQRWKVLMNQPSATAYVNPWYSPSASYLTVARGNQPIVCGEKYSFNVMYTVSPNMTDFISFYYSINSKSSILIYGHVKHKPTHDTILNYSEFRNLLGTVESTNKTDVYPMVHRFPLSVKVTPSMAPVSELLLYYVKSDGEIVATTYTIEVGHCFENKVKTAWHTDVQKPGSKTQYHVEAAPWSLCGISVVDKSTIFLGKSKSNLINATGTFHQLRKYHPTPMPSWRDCKQRNDAELPLRRRRRNFNDRSINYVDAMQAFNDFGVIVMSDLTLLTRPCPPVPAIKRDWNQRNEFRLFSASIDFSDIPMINSAVAAAAIGVAYNDQLLDQTAMLRSYFPETWLWTLTPTGKEGKATIDCTLPDTITDWVGYTTCISPVHGLGIAPPTTITAFQVFFLDYRLPYSVKRGEMMRLKASLFNYMNHSLPVKIKLDEIAGIDLHLSDPNVSFCVKPRDSVVHEFILRPRILGEVNITVSASIDESYSEPCGPETLLFTRDVIVKPILILPEGFPVEKTKSSLVCPKDFADDSAFVWELTLPEDVIPDSGRAYLNLIGDILGPALENLDELVKLPNGCGEQNMILFVPNIYVIKYLDAIGVDNYVLRAKAIGYMEKGYQRELNYRHADGSYSPFSFSQSSIWLTAFVLKSFAQAKSLIPIEERELRLSVEWIKHKQLENGCFEAIGNVFQKHIKGGLHEYEGSLSALTAYILIALVESSVPLPPSLTNNALKCLEKGVASNNLYTEILATYALTLLKHPNASSRSLINLATSQNNLLWWEDKTKPSKSLSIEMTAYAVLILVNLGGDENMIAAFKAVRWLSKQRNAEGGFSSTQDTIVGLEALTKYAIAVQTSNVDLSVLITAKEIEYAYKLNDDNRMVLTQIRLPVLPTTVEIFTQGESCVLIQSNIKYNVPHIDDSEVFDLSVGIRPFKYEIECLVQQITICARYTMADGESNMALLEVNMISGYIPDRATLNALLDPSSKVKRFEVDQDVVTIYFDKMTGQSTCISFNIIQEYFVDRLEPANVKLYDYYQQELSVSTNYKIASICSSAEPIDKQETNEKMLLEATDESLSSSVKLSKSLMSTKVGGFVINDQELDTPDGIEGPVLVYVNPDDDYKTETTTTTNGLPDFTTAYAIEDETVPLVQPEDEEPPAVKPEIEIKNTTMVTETNVPSPTGAAIQHCPVCMDKLPSDIGNVYCSASSAAKVAIRRLRKARLLLDLHAARQVQRLYGKVEFTLSPNCSCPPLDDPGSFALILNKNNDFLSSGDHKQTLDDSFHIYGLPLVSGMPCKLAEARVTCFNEENIPCTNEKDSLVYG